MAKNEDASLQDETFLTVRYHCKLCKVSLHTFLDGEIVLLAETASDHWGSDDSNISTYTLSVPPPLPFQMCIYLRNILATVSPPPVLNQSQIMAGSSETGGKTSRDKQEKDVRVTRRPAETTKPGAIGGQTDSQTAKQTSKQVTYKANKQLANPLGKQQKLCNQSARQPSNR